MSISKARISFLFSFYNAADAVESSLVPILSLSEVESEIIVINDGSTDNTDEVIASILDHYPEKNVFYFTYDIRRGHGISLNEALRESNAPYFCVIDKPCSIDESALNDTLTQLDRSSALVAIPNAEVPANRDVIRRMLNSMKVPASCCYIFSKNRIRPDRLVFNPFISIGHSCELLLRSNKKPEIIETIGSILPTDETYVSVINTDDRSTILFQSGMEHLAKEGTFAIQPSSENMNDTEIHKTWKRVQHLRSEGHYAEALDLVNLILENDKEHQEAEDTKIFLLERLNRYVEASELKFLRKRKRMHVSATDQPLKKEEILVSRPAIEPIPEKVKAKSSETEDEAEVKLPEHPKVHSFKYTVIIPVTGVALPFIEPCLLSFSEYCNPENTELIVVDNACLDDTYSYLDQLRERNFFNIRIIKNIRNAGFARSVNQGIEKAHGDFICVMHADVLVTSDAPSQLAAILDVNPGIGLIGPVTDYTMNPDQAKIAGEDPTEFSNSTYADSFLMVFRKKDAIEWDTEYKQAWFDDVDLCWNLRKKGYEIAIADGVFVRHYLGAFTDSMGLGYDSTTYMENHDRFNAKWGIPAPEIKKDANTDSIEELIRWGHTVNITHPYPSVVEHVKELMTSELRTTILGASFNQHELTGLVRIMMTIDQRDVLRQLEEKLDTPIEESLRSELIHFYYNRSVYSRCLKYLDMTNGQESLTNRMFRLRIAWSEKNIELVKTLIDELMSAAPGHPEVYKIAGDLNKVEGHDKEAETFYALADQLDPFRFQWPVPAKSKSGSFENAEESS